MTVYVDQLVDYGDTARQRRLPHTRWCHLTADSRDELHAFAARLGLRRAWFQDHRIGWHYDITPNKRAQAVRLGAVELPAGGFGRLMMARRDQPHSEANSASPAPACIARPNTPLAARRTMSSTGDTIRAAAITIEAAIQAQRRAEPHHVDFYDTARAIERAAAVLHDFTAGMRTELARYGHGRQLRTDIDLSPTEVLDEAVRHCDTLRDAFDDAQTAADFLADRCGRLASA